MKKCNLMLFLLSSILLVGCATSDTNVEQKKDDDIVEILESQVDEMNGGSNEADALAEEREAPLIDDVISAYVETIQNIESDTPNEASFGLIYADEDDIPELYYIDSSLHLSGATIYNYANGQINELGIVGSNGEFLYTPRKNLLIHLWSGMGIDQWGYYKIQGNKMECLRTYECPIGGMDEEQVPYMIDDTAVSREEYLDDYKKLKNSLPDNRAGVMRVKIADSFLLKNFNSEDFIMNYKNYVVETKADPLSSIDYLSTTVSNLANPEWINLEEEFINQTNSKPEEILMMTSLANDDGAFIFTGNELNIDMGPAYEGKLWYISPNSSAEVILEAENGYTIIDGDIEGEYLYITEWYASAGMSYVYEIKNGKPSEVPLISNVGEIVDYSTFDPYIKVLDSAYDNISNAEGDFMGHTWKPYYFYLEKDIEGESYSYSIREYVGHKISEDELISLCGFDMPAEIKKLGLTIDDIYSRENGIINVNVHVAFDDKDIEYNNVNYDVNNGCYVNAYGENSLEGSMFGGIYKDKISK